jgi:hypothetical protein
MEELRFAGNEADLGLLMEQRELRQAGLLLLKREQERMKELMRLRLDKMLGRPPGWDGTEPMETFEV